MFGDQVAVLHSGLSDGERADAWRALRRGERRVVVGARSAVFAPVVGPGVIVVDEEHEATYKNGEAPRYHAREVAAVRARLEGARLVLGSATPSLESWAEAGDGKRLRLVRLPERVGAGRLPAVELVDLRTAPKVPGSGAIPWSEALDREVSRVLARGEQGMLLLNRRGFAAFLQCPDCGHVPECPSCSISLTVHQSPPLAPLSLLRAPGAAARHVRRLRARGGPDARHRHPAARALVVGAVPGGAPGADGPRHDEHPLGPPPDPRHRRAAARWTSCSAPR